jgi:Na+-driven multidrug efflux pump
MSKKGILGLACVGLALLLIPDVGHAQGLTGIINNPDPANTDLDDVRTILVRVIKYVLAFAGAIAAIFVVVSGYQYILAAGNPEKLEKAKMGLTWAIVGFILTASAYAIVNLLQSALGSRRRVADEFAGPSTVNTTIEQVALIVFAFGGAVAVLFLILGGFRYVTSQGNQDSAQSAKQTILYAVIGLIVVFMSYLIFQLVAGTIKVI